MLPSWTASGECCLVVDLFRASEARLNRTLLAALRRFSEFEKLGRARKGMAVAVEGSRVVFAGGKLPK